MGDEKYYILGTLCRRLLMGVEQWEVLFEGTVTTANYNSNGASAMFAAGTASPLFIAGDTVRLTVGGKPFMFVAATDSVGAQVGNIWLSGLQEDGTQDTAPEIDYCVIAVKAGLYPQNIGNFYSRNPGTYSIKLERMVS